MSYETKEEGNLVSMLLEANKAIRYACVCDADGKILWNSRRNNIENMMTLEDTNASLKRALENWKERDKLSAKIGRGRYSIVDYEKIKRVTVPLKDNHLLYVHVEADQPAYIGDIMKIVNYVDEHFSGK